VSLNDLTSYVQQLRNFLPKATAMLRRDQQGLEEGEGSGLWEEDPEEDYITEFLSPAQITDWNKLSPKVGSHVAAKVEVLGFESAYNNSVHVC